MLCPHCGAANDEAAENCFTCGKGLAALTQGFVLASRYEVQSPLGRGGMGVVYKALDRTLDEVVAIKVLRTGVAATADLARRFRSEIKLARKVRHRNVCGIHEYGEHGAFRFISMEFVDGVDLKTLVRGQRGLPPPEAYAAAIQVAEGLQAIHDAGVIHRDLKAANIMRDKRGLVRVMDFGIAKQAIGTGMPDVTLAGEVVGTPEYMSPEQIRGRSVDFRSDVYSLGIVIFEVFTGRVPFESKTALGMLFKHLEEAPPLKGADAARIPRPVVRLLERALAKDAADRPATAASVADALRAAARETDGLSPVSWEPATALDDAAAAVPRELDADFQDALPALTGALRDEDPDLRRETARALGEMGPAAEAAVPALLELEDDPDRSVAAAVALAVERITGMRQSRKGVSSTTTSSNPMGFAVLVQGLKDKDPEVRGAAASALGEMGAEAREAIPALIEARNDAEAWVGKAAAGALKRIFAARPEVPQGGDVVSGKAALGATGAVGDAHSTQAGVEAPARRRTLPAPITEFVLGLVKALLKTHYYTPDHPLGRQAQVGLFELFQHALQDRRELTFLYLRRREWDEAGRNEIVVEGFDEQSVPLGEALSGGTGELYLPKFTEFFLRHELASFSLKEGLAPREFESFVELMADLSDSGPSEDGTARFGQRLAELGVRKVSVVFRRDLQAEGRHIPWRVEVTLARLRKDLRAIPLYRNLSDAEFRKLKLQIVDDCIRPHRRPELVRDILANADLIERDLFAVRDIAVVEEVLATLAPEMLVAVVEETSRDVTRLMEKGELLPWEEAQLSRLRKLLRKLSAWTIQRQPDVGTHAFEDVFGRRLLEVWELPVKAREAVRREALAHVIAERLDPFMEDLRGVRSGPASAGLERLAVCAAERLLSEGRIPELHRLLEPLHEAGRPLDLLGARPGLERLAEALRLGRKSERESARALLVFAGAPAVPVLLGLLEEACGQDEASVRKAAAFALSLLGEACREPLSDALGRRDVSPRFLQDVLDVLAEVGFSQPARVAALLHHHDPEVRLRAIHALHRHLGVRAEPYLISALQDPLPRVRARAAAAAGQLDPMPPRTLQRLVEMVTTAGEAEEVQVAALQALAERGNLHLSDGSTLEAALLTRLPRRRGMMGRLLGRVLHPEEAKLSVATVRALGRIGGNDSLDALGELRHQADEELGRAIAEATGQIRSRLQV